MGGTVIRIAITSVAASAALWIAPEHTVTGRSVGAAAPFDIVALMAETRGAHVFAAVRVERATLSDTAFAAASPAILVRFRSVLDAVVAARRLTGVIANAAVTIGSVVAVIALATGFLWRATTAAVDVAFVLVLGLVLAARGLASPVADSAFAIGIRVAFQRVSARAT